MITDSETVDEFLQRELTAFYSQVIAITDACEGFTEDEKEQFLKLVIAFMSSVIGMKVDAGKVGFTFSTNDTFNLRIPK